MQNVIFTVKTQQFRPRADGQVGPDIVALLSLVWRCEVPPGPAPTPGAAGRTSPAGTTNSGSPRLVRGSSAPATAQ